MPSEQDGEGERVLEGRREVEGWGVDAEQGSY